jgi:hypothetical protein
VKPAVGAAAVEHTGGGSLRHDRRGKSIDEQRSASVSALKADTTTETLAASGPMRGPNHLSPSQTAGGSASTICSTPSPPPSPRRAHSPRFPVLCTVCLLNDDDHGSFSMCVCCGQCFCGECTTLLRRVACCPNCNAEGGTSDKTCVSTPPPPTWPRVSNRTRQRVLPIECTRCCLRCMCSNQRLAPRSMCCLPPSVRHEFRERTRAWHGPFLGCLLALLSVRVQVSCVRSSSSLLAPLVCTGPTRCWRC